MASVVKLIKAKTISFTDEMINHYKELGLNEQELIALILLYKKIDEKNNDLKITELTSKMTLNENEISNLVVGLVQKGFINIDMDQGSESFDLEGAYKMLAGVLDQDEKEQSFSNRQDLLSQIVLFIETKYAKNCSPADLMVINHWIDLGYSYQEIQQAILDSLTAKKLHLKYADAILANRHQNQNREHVEYDEDIKKMLDAVYVKH